MVVKAIDVYEKARLEALSEFDEFDKNDGINASISFTLSNNSRPTDYDAWSAGCDRFVDDNYDALKKWVY